MIWTYGNAWEQYSIEEGQVWGVLPSSKVAVYDLFERKLPDFMFLADMLYVDPPWNLSLLNSFATKAGLSHNGKSFYDFAGVLFEHIGSINSLVCYLETVSYTHLRAPRDRTRSRMPSSA